MAAQDNKFLTFELGGEIYGISILKIKEIIGMMSITKVPKLPDFVKGVINLRGKIIPVIDLRLKFGLVERPYDERTSIIVMELIIEGATKTSGIVVDTVKEVLDIEVGNIDPPPQYGVDVDQAFLTGMGKVDEDVIMLLDADKILTAGELKTLITV
jgi:purine-binding chemotaxis protein CheW